jgi:hypothetical protein
MGIIPNCSAGIGIKASVAGLAQPGLEKGVAVVMGYRIPADVAVESFVLSHERQALITPHCAGSHDRTPLMGALRWGCRPAHAMDMKNFAVAVCSFEH